MSTHWLGFHQSQYFSTSTLNERAQGRGGRYELWQSLKSLLTACGGSRYRPGGQEVRNVTTANATLAQHAWRRTVSGNTGMSVNRRCGRTGWHHAECWGGGHHAILKSEDNCSLMVVTSLWRLNLWSPDSGDLGLQQALFDNNRNPSQWVEWQKLGSKSLRKQ